VSDQPDYADALAQGRARGRGAGLAPGNRFESLRLHVLGEHLDQQAREHPCGAQVQTQLLTERTNTIINRVESPDIGFPWTLNPYRGCEHGCIYCYARPTHETLGLSCGLDFETRIVAKQDAPRLLRRELASPKWRGEPIVMSGVTDPYQPPEAKLRITRGCLEVMAEARQPVTIVTKNRLVLRDLDLLCELAEHRAVSVAVSLTTLDNRLASKMEPRASSPSDRLATIRALADANVPVRVMTAPIIPGLTDHEIPSLLRAASDAGAQGAGYVLLRLPHQLKALFLDWLQRHEPGRARKVESLIRQARGGKLYAASPYKRRRGQGARAEQIRETFEIFKRRYKLNQGGPGLSSAAFRRPSPPEEENDGQMNLFAGASTEESNLFASVNHEADAERREASD